MVRRNSNIGATQKSQVYQAIDPSASLRVTPLALRPFGFAQGVTPLASHLLNNGSCT